MSLLPLNALANSGPMLDTRAAAPSPGGASAFSNIYAQAAGSNAPAEVVSQPVSAAQVAPGLSGIAAPVTPADVLKPKLDYVGNTLSALNARVSSIEPKSGAESLENRLELLNVQYQAIGNTFENSAAKNDPMQLLKLQNDIYQLDEELELVSRVVDQATSGVRSLLQTQV